MSKRRKQRPPKVKHKPNPYVERRAKRYREDAKYREQVGQYQREAMQARRGTQLKDCRDNLPMLSRIASKRSVHMRDGDVMTFECLTYAETAEALMVSENRLRIWAARDVIPEPVCRADTEGERLLLPTASAPVYLIDEVRAIMKVLGKHQSRIAYIRPNQHQHTIKAIYEAVRKVRIEHGLYN